MEISVLFCYVKGEKPLVIQMEISSTELKKQVCFLPSLNESLSYY